MTTRKQLFTGSVYEELAGYARAVVVDDRIFVAGTVGVDFSTGEMPADAESQTDTALDTIEKVLADADAVLGDIVRVRVFVPDPSHVEVISLRIKQRLRATFPANTTVCSPLAVPGAHVEIEVEAIRGSASSGWDKL